MLRLLLLRNGALPPDPGRRHLLRLSALSFARPRPVL
ncbi:hypothetical protein [Jannaschia seohaensis]